MRKFTESPISVLMHSYALNDDHEVSLAENAVPLGRLPRAKLRCDIKVDRVVTDDMVELKTTLSFTSCARIKKPALAAEHRLLQQISDLSSF